MGLLHGEGNRFWAWRTEGLGFKASESIEKDCSELGVTASGYRVRDVGLRVWGLLFECEGQEVEAKAVHCRQRRNNATGLAGFKAKS